MIEAENYYQHTRPEVAALLPEKLGRVLEIGCGEGTFSCHLKNCEEHWGVEPVESIAERAVGQVKTKVLTGIYDEVESEIPDGYFDLVICNDVIEHMTSHDEFLEKIKSKMKPGGHLVGSIPNIRYVPVLYGLLIKRDWQYENSGVMDRTHFRYFTAKSLRRSFLEHDFQIEEFRGINSLAEVKVNLKCRLRGIALKVFNLLTLTTQKDTLFQQHAFRLRL